MCPWSLPSNGEVCHQNPERQDNGDGAHKVPECHYFQSSAKYDVRREDEDGGQQVSDGRDDWAPNPQENLNGTSVKHSVERANIQEVTINPALYTTPESAMPEMANTVCQSVGQ